MLDVYLTCNFLKPRTMIFISATVALSALLLAGLQCAPSHFVQDTIMADEKLVPLTQIKNWCHADSKDYTMCETEFYSRQTMNNKITTNEHSTARRRWIIFKSRDTDLNDYIERTVKKVLDEDNKARDSSGKASRVIMEFEFRHSKIAKAISFDATEQGFKKLNGLLEHGKSEFGIEAPRFIHADQTQSGNRIINDNNLHPQAYIQQKEPPSDAARVARQCNVTVAHRGLRHTDWGVRALINTEDHYLKKVPKVPIRRAFNTQIFIIGQGIDKAAKHASALENTKIFNGFKVRPQQRVTIEMSDEYCGVSTVSNLGTYQAQVISSISKHAEIVPIVLETESEHYADYILRAFEAVIELATQKSAYRSLCTFSGKIISARNFDSFRFTEMIGKLLAERDIKLSYGIDEEREYENIINQQKYGTKGDSVTDFLQIGWYKHALAVMSVNRDLVPTAKQRAIYDALSKVEGYNVLLAPGATVHVPYIYTSDASARDYIGEFCYVSSAISAASAAAVESMYASSIATKYVENVETFHGFVVNRSRSVDENRKLLTLVPDFCSIVDVLKYDAKAGNYLCKSKYEDYMYYGDSTAYSESKQTRFYA